MRDKLLKSFVAGYLGLLVTYGTLLTNQIIKNKVENARVVDSRTGFNEDYKYAFDDDKDGFIDRIKIQRRPLCSPRMPIPSQTNYYVRGTEGFDTILKESFPHLR